MEKARFNIFKNKAGKPVIEIIFSDGKKVPFSPKLNHPNPLSLNGKEIEVERQKGQIIKIICDGKVIYSPSNKPMANSSPKAYSRPQAQSHGNTDIYSKAPYNFIPLNDRVVEAESVPELDRYHQDRFTGYIDLEIQALTPLYIRDALTTDEYRKRDEMEKEKKTFINPDFFSPGGILRIPGSSIRGMIRTLVEIVSYGKFENFDNKRLYYRGLADVSGLRKEYQRHMSSRDSASGIAQYKMSAGILKKEGFNYFIIPAKRFRQIPKSEARKRIEALGKRYEEFKFYEVEDGYIVVSGTMQNKKRDWLIEYPDKEVKPVPIQEEDIKNYKNDSNRSDKVPDLLKLAAKGVPCFYTKYQDMQGRERIAFGHTAMFRLPYQKTIGDHVPSELKDKEITDLATAIFGDTESRASRVFFEDAIFDGEPETALLKTEIPKILSGPKPTCFQHYIEQRPENLQNHPKNLAHYNSENPIRGYKLYWHRKPERWQEEELSFDEKEFNAFIKTSKIDKKDIEKFISNEKGKVRLKLSELTPSLKEKFYDAVGIYETQHTKITPVKEDTTFRGRIRFENLSKVELGALLFVLDLPEGLAHKLGMAKPLGLGSVRIKPELFISDRKKRYTDLFYEWDGIQPLSPERIKEYKSAFEKFILTKLNETSKNNLWDIERLKELKTMLDFKNKPENNETEYMGLNEFRQRKVLPKPTKLIKQGGRT